MKEICKVQDIAKRKDNCEFHMKSIKAAWVLRSICIYDSHGVCSTSWKLVIIIQLLLFTEYLTSAKTIPEYFTSRCFKSSCYLIIVIITKSGEGPIIHSKPFSFFYKNGWILTPKTSP